jgi:hypothetical protein
MPKNKYRALQNHLAGLDGDEWAASFVEIEALLGFPLPSSARAFYAWWSNSPKHSGTDAWRQAGFRASVNLEKQRVTFRRGLERPLSKKARRALALANRPPPPDQNAYLDKVRRLYEEHGIKALHSRFLDKHGGLFIALWNKGLKLSDIVDRLGLNKEFAEWKSRGRVYAGKFRRKWTWETALEEMRAVREQQGALPTMEWFRQNDYSGLIKEIFNSGHTFEEARAAVGDFTSSHFRTSRSGIRWRSHPEASLSDFLHARGIRHWRGERYDAGYAEASGRHHGHYDLHFRAQDGREIDVEVWGDLPDKLSGGRYARTRAAKESWNSKNSNFLGIQYVDCLSDQRLTAILKPYIGVLEPFNFEKPQDPYIETSHWTDSDELLETCRSLAAQQPDGIMPNEQWMRKRGRFADREGPVYNTLAVRINQWLGGTRRARQLLGQSDHSTEQWTAEKAIAAWREFEETHGVTPTQATSRVHRDRLPPEEIRWGQAIRGACVRYGVLDEARRGKSARKVIWTTESVTAAWGAFEVKYRMPVNRCVGSSGQKYSRDQFNEASRIYSAARKLGMVAFLKGRARP